MAENAWIQDRGQPVGFANYSFDGSFDATSSAGTIMVRPGVNHTSCSTAIVPFNSYIIGGAVFLDTALAGAEELTVKIRDGTTVKASTQLTSGTKSVAWTFTPTENTLSAGASLNVLVSHTSLTTALVTVDVWLNHRSESL